MNDEFSKLFFKKMMFVSKLINFDILSRRNYWLLCTVSQQNTDPRTFVSVEDQPDDLLIPPTETVLQSTLLNQRYLTFIQGYFFIAIMFTMILCKLSCALFITFKTIYHCSVHHKRIFIFFFFRRFCAYRIRKSRTVWNVDGKNLRQRILISNPDGNS